MTDALNAFFLTVGVGYCVNVAVGGLIQRAFARVWQWEPFCD